ncbi:MAG: Stf0 sulfotransferase family protein [Verrucomicrobiota bacterium]|nr:Stf0 sulfotransferase family protein [Verrucomicrobiota bacterium]
MNKLFRLDRFAVAGKDFPVVTSSMFGLPHHFFHQTKCYALCTVARSGAHLLTGGLRASRLAGRPLQYFNHQLAPRYAARYGLDAARDFPRYVRGIVAAAATPNSVFGFRMESWDLDGFLARLRDSGDFGGPQAQEIKLLQTAFPGLRCIQLTRQDKLRQAISKARAMQTELWVSGGENRPLREPEFDADLIAHCLLSAQRSEEMWTAFFQRNGIEPLPITYEDLCDDYTATVRRVLAFLRLRLPRGFDPGQPQTVRQADTLTEEWVQRYSSLAALKS